MDDEDDLLEECSDFKKSLLKRRIVLLTSPIDEKSVGEVKGELIELSMASPEEEIILYINNDGGEVWAGLALYDFLTTFLKASVVGLVGARCHSSALLALQGCVKRVATQNSVFLLHPSSVDIGVNYHPKIKSEMDEIIKNLAEIETRCNKIIARRANLSVKEIEGLTFANKGKGTVLFGDEAQKKGLVDSLADAESYKIF